MISRRVFLARAGALSTVLAAAPVTGVFARQAAGPTVLEARPGTAQILDTGEAATPVWGYTGTVPGPVIRARRGGEVWIRLKNNLPDATTIHWHGIRIDNAMDGVGNLTQAPVPPGETFDYRFTVPDAGTFWYHPHHLSWEQVARGLYGALIVEEDEAPDVDQDVVLIADDWRLRDDGRIDEESFNALHDRAHAGRLGNVFTTNGLPYANIPVTSGERIRLRLINTCNARVLTLRFEALEPELIALDGQPVPSATLANAEIELSPAQRADLLIDMTGAPGAKSAITAVTREDALPVGQFVYHAAPRLEKTRPALVLPDNDIHAPDLNEAMTVDLVMEGGAMGMGRMQEAVYKGETLGMRELVREHGQVWTFNGVAGMPEKPMFTFKRGQPVRVRMVNNTNWAHAMHFHGHHFREVAEPGTGKPGPWRDTLLVNPNETRTIAFTADNPGKWMIHCHMLEHQAGGMGTWFEVTG